MGEILIRQRRSQIDAREGTKSVRKG